MHILYRLCCYYCSITEIDNLSMTYLACGKMSSLKVHENTSTRSAATEEGCTNKTNLQHCIRNSKYIQRLTFLPFMAPYFVTVFIILFIMHDAQSRYNYWHWCLLLYRLSVSVPSLLVYKGLQQLAFPVNVVVLVIIVI